jgi:RNA polymerase sigma-70 factor (ECF subfamily)
MPNYKKLSDEELVDLVRKKDQELYRYLIDRYQAKLLRYAVYLTADNDQAADVIQEAFIKAFVNLQSFNSKKKFSSWLYRITHNEAMNILNRYKQELPILKDVDFASNIDLEDDFIRKELENRTKECLSQMPLIYKEVLTLYYLEEQSYEEISDILRVAIGTVGTRLSRAKILMKKICQKQKK